MNRINAGKMSRLPIDAIDTSRLRALADDHFTANGLRRAFAVGFRGTERLCAIMHFGRTRCRLCWRRLEGLATLEAPSLPAEGSDVAFDPVLVALRRLVNGYREPEAIDQLRSMHAFWFHRCRLEGIGFFRLLVEESRQHGFDHPTTGLAVAEETLDLLESLPFENLGLPWIDLKALARAAVGDEHRAAGRHRPAFEHLETARRELMLGTGDPELWVTWHEMVIELTLAIDFNGMARDLVERAMELVRQIEVEGRDAETLVLLGLVQLRFGEDHRAADAFRQALSALVPGKTARLRLRVLLLLALAEVRNRCFTEAREHLAAARALEAGHPTPLLRAEGLWIEGTLHLETESYGEAEEPLRKSLQGFQMLGLTARAMQVLLSLTRVYVATGRIQEFAKLEQEFRPLLEAPAARKWILTMHEWFLRWATKQGLPLPLIQEPRSPGGDG